MKPATTLGLAMLAFVAVSVVGAQGRAQDAAAPAPPPSFTRDVIPLFTKLGCNAGGCHGAAQGKNGFKLSLFGFDAEADWRRITRELGGRRIDFAEPEASLVYAKPLGILPHKGGVRMREGDDAATLLRRWIDSGAALDPKPLPRLTGITISPRAPGALAAGQELGLALEATWDDGEAVDVGRWGIWSSSDEQVAKVGDGGLVRAIGAGEAVIVARYGSRAEVKKIVVRSAAAPRDDPLPTAPIDRFMEERRRVLGVEKAGRADDGTFLRRVRLDITGTLPTIDETRRFLADPDPLKRERLVDRLLGGPEFLEIWGTSWLEVLRIESQKLGVKAMDAFTDWWMKEIVSGRPFDELARELVTSEGSSFLKPAVNFFVVDQDPKGLAETTAQLFLGVRLQCAQCHNHPFDRWTMDDYYGFAAFFARVALKTSDDTRERVVYERATGEVRHPLDQRVMAPRFLGGDEGTIAPGRSRREALADLLTGAAPGGLARNVANRLFARFFGRGLVDPVDDVRVSNPPSHPELLEYLATRLQDSRFDVRALARELVLSETYALGRSAAKAPATAFATAPMRRLGAEELLNAIVLVTGVPHRLRGLPEESDAYDLTDGEPSSYFLDIFGRPRRTSACACERRGEPTLGQALHLMNGDTIAQKLREPKGRLMQAVKAGASDEAVLTDLLLAAYQRLPRQDEIDRLKREIPSGDGRLGALEDIYWAVLNSDEFLFNH